MLLPDIFALIDEDAQVMSRLGLIGFAPTKHPLRSKLQGWININIIESSMMVSQIWML